jgi:hypothetical protein
LLEPVGVAPRKTCPPYCRLRCRASLRSAGCGSSHSPAADATTRWRNCLAWLNQMYGTELKYRSSPIDPTDLDAPSFPLLGDTGEGDISQYAPTSIIDSVAPGTDFMMICSDVICPAGGTLEYAYKHCWPYRHYPRPIYALPGNHDWYDGLRGFMSYFCGQTSAPPYLRRSSLFSRAGLLDRLWLEDSEPDDPIKRQFLETLRQASSQQARLPGPYDRVSTGPLPQPC